MTFQGHCEYFHPLDDIVYKVIIRGGSSGTTDWFKLCIGKTLMRKSECQYLHQTLGSGRGGCDGGGGRVI